MELQRHLGTLGTTVGTMFNERHKELGFVLKVRASKSSENIKEND